MAENKNKDKLEREYTIPLRRHWLNVPQYERTGKAIKAIKIFLAKHMKVEDRDVRLVKIDSYLNNELWFRGRASPPAKVKVKATKENGVVQVTFVIEPDHIKFLRAKNERRQKPSEKIEEKKEEVKTEENKEEVKVEEKEKEQSVAEEAVKEAKLEAKAQKHETKPVRSEHPRRMALQK
jgi:large subunit ribosomal protein L31e